MRQAMILGLAMSVTACGGPAPEDGPDAAPPGDGTVIATWTINGADPGNTGCTAAGGQTIANHPAGTVPGPTTWGESCDDPTDNPYVTHVPAGVPQTITLWILAAGDHPLAMGSADTEVPAGGTVHVVVPFAF